MTLATRCTSCGTIFRVVQDQLKVSDGWVRCGRCNEVFNAMEGLFDLQREVAGRSSSRAAAPAPAAPPPPGASRTSPPATGTASAATARSLAGQSAAVAEDDTLGGGADVTKVVHEVAAQEHTGITKGPAAATSAGQASRTGSTGPRRPREQWRDPEDENVSILPADDLQPAFADAKFAEESVQGASPVETRPATEPAQLESQVVRSGSSSGRPSSSSRSKSRRSRSSRSSRRSSRSEAVPGFVQKAAAEERWRQPGVRAALALVVLLQAALLAGQMTYQWRDHVAARWPQARPWVTALCGQLGCQVLPPQAIHALVVESTTLSRFEGVPDGYRLTVVLRNQALYEVRQPYLDLSLTDGDGLVVARRALAPSEFRGQRGVLPPQAETTLQLPLVIEGHRVAGYTVAAFYP
jgi:predicted Zn finger-like uncharacterized protein